MSNVNTRNIKIRSRILNAYEVLRRMDLYDPAGAHNAHARCGRKAKYWRKVSAEETVSLDIDPSGPPARYEMRPLALD